MSRLKEIEESNRIVRNSANLLNSDHSYQKVFVDGEEYLAMREEGSLRSRFGTVIETKPIAILIGRIIDGKVIPLDSGDKAKWDYLINTNLLSKPTISILSEINDAGFDVSNFPKPFNPYEVFEAAEEGELSPETRQLYKEIFNF